MLGFGGIGIWADRGLDIAFRRGGSWCLETCDEMTSWKTRGSCSGPDIGRKRSNIVVVEPFIYESSITSEFVYLKHKRLMINNPNIHHINVWKPRWTEGKRAKKCLLEKFVTSQYKKPKTYLIVKFCKAAEYPALVVYIVESHVAISDSLKCQWSKKAFFEMTSDVR